MFEAAHTETNVTGNFEHIVFIQLQIMPEGSRLRKKETSPLPTLSHLYENLKLIFHLVLFTSECNKPFLG